MNKKLKIKKNNQNNKIENYQKIWNSKKRINNKIK